MKYLKYLFLLGISLNVAYAQHSEPQRDTLRQHGGVPAGFNEPNSIAISPESPADGGASGIRYGLYGGGNINSFNADFRKLPGVPNCCSRFTEGNGIGAAFGFLAEFPINNDVVFELRAGYSQMNGTLRASEFSVIQQGGGAVPAMFEHTIEAKPATIALSPMVAYHVTEKLMIHAGTDLGYLIGRDYHQYEKIVEPETGTFTNGKRTRNDSTGSLPNAQGIQSSLTFGTSYDIPVNRSGSLIAAPEAFYTLGLTNFVRETSWRANSGRIGVALKYAPDKEPMPAPPVLASVKDASMKTKDSAANAIPKELPAEPSKSALAANVTAMGLMPDGSEVPLTKLAVEDVVSTNMRPLLNYVFFDQNSASIPGRYARMSPEQAEKFSIRDLDNATTLPTYYQVLNIIGRRLRENPSARISVVGTESGSEQGNRSLSQQRAMAVRDYLRDVWHVDQNRMKVEARALPANATNESDPDGIAENRRVEIISDNGDVTQPLLTVDTLRRSKTSAIRFHPTAQAQAGLSDWTLVASQDGKPLKKFNGTGTMPANLDWNVDAEQASTPRAPGEIEYSLLAKDAAGQMYATPAQKLPVESVQSDQGQGNQMKKLDRFSLILFDFNRAELNPANRRIIDVMKKRISPNATVSVTGFTDRIGDAEYNRKLSEDRARLAASVLNASTSTVSGMGESAPQFDNNLPEGRFYNRTVDVLVETPVK